MSRKIKIALWAVMPFFSSVCLAALVCSYINGTSCNALNSIYRYDCDNDGVADRVYYYTYNIAENLISLGIDSDSDGRLTRFIIITREGIWRINRC